MDKYDKIYDKYEGSLKSKTKELKLFYTNKFYDFILEEYGVEELEKQKHKSLNDVISNVICNFDIYVNEVQMWFNENIINNLNKENIILSFIQMLNRYLVSKNKNGINDLMKSFISTGLIKNIELKKDIFYITLLDDKIIKFTSLLDTEKEVKSFVGGCHYLCYDYIKTTKIGKKNINCLTVLENNLYNCSRYHSFVVVNDIVYDFARNILISFDNYKYIFRPTIISCTSANKLIEEIKELEEKDKEFRDNIMYPVLKYAMNKQMNGK